MSRIQRDVLAVFRQFLMKPGQMLCFYGPLLEKHRSGLHQLTELGMLVKEEFKGGYSLTDAGFQAMKDCRGAPAKSPAGIKKR
jgi:hypothetical protein